MVYGPLCGGVTMVGTNIVQICHCRFNVCRMTGYAY